MNGNRSLPALRRLAVSGITLCAAAILATAGPARRAPEGPDDARLDKKVRLLLGETTAAKVMDELSRQTGLQIDAVDYLQERRLIVTLDRLAARQALDALAALNDWTWRMTEPGHYLVARRAVRRPARTSDIPRAMQAALPKDFRVYLRLPDLRTKTLFEDTGNATTDMVLSAVNKDRAALLASLREKLAQGAEVPCGTLTRPQEALLLFTLMLQGYEESQALLHNDAYTHCIDLSNAVLELEKGEILMVKTYVTPNFPIGFGKNVVNPAARR